METKVNYSIVGAFVIVLIAAIVLAVIWLSAGFSTEEYDTYKIYMEESVSGLETGAPVEFNGVNVGTVSSMEIDPLNPQWVILLISIKSSTPVTMGTRATLNSRGVTGINYIALIDRGNDSRKLLIPPKEKYAVIPTSPSIFVRLDTTLAELSSSLQSILNPQNQEEIKQTLLNLRNITDNLVANNAKLNDIIQNTAAASEKFPYLLQNSISSLKIFQQQTLPAASQVINNLNDATDNLLDLSNAIKQNPTILLRGQKTPPLGPGER